MLSENNNQENFKVIIASKTKEDDTVILTSNEMSKKWIESAVYNFDSSNRQYSAYLNETSMQNVVTKEEID